MRLRVVGIGLLVAVGLALLIYSKWRPRPLIVSGFIEAQDIRLGSRVGGRVKSVLVSEGESVEADAVLLELEPYDLAERRAQAAAELAARQAELDRLRAGYRIEQIEQAKAKRDQLAAHLDQLRAGPRATEIAVARSRENLAATQLDLAQRTFDRVKASFARSAVSADEMDRAADALQTAQGTLEVRRQELAQLTEGTRIEEIDQAAAQLREAEAALKLLEAGYQPQEIAAAAAAVAAAAAGLAAVDQQIAELTITAPVAGVVESIDLQPGDLIAPGAPAISLLDMHAAWVRAYVPENRLNLTLGQRVPVRVDAFGRRQFTGHISFIARQAEFTPGNVQTPQERSEQVFRIKVTLDEAMEELRPGMAADVLLDEAVKASAGGQSSNEMAGQSDAEAK